VRWRSRWRREAGWAACLVETGTGRWLLEYVGRQQGGGKASRYENEDARGGWC
jgi:hypothetical protein